MINKPLVSVLMTAYNREKYIAEAIESVMASTYQNWELIIVDDGSKDRTVEIAKRYEDKDERIKLYINEKNLGDYPNRNNAASYAKGKYLKYVDADDLIYPHGLEVMVRSIEQFPEAGFALCKNDDDITPLPVFLTPEQTYIENYLKKTLLNNSPLGAIIKKNAFIDIGGFSGKKHIGDEELWLKLAVKYPLVKMVMGTAFWRSHNEQQSKDRRKDLMVVCNSFFLNINAIISDACALLDIDKQVLLEKYKTRYIRNNILSPILRKLKFKHALFIYDNSNLKIIDIIKAIRK